MVNTRRNAATLARQIGCAIIICKERGAILAGQLRDKGAIRRGVACRAHVIGEHDWIEGRGRGHIRVPTRIPGRRGAIIKAHADGAE